MRHRKALICSIFALIFGVFACGRGLNVNRNASISAGGPSPSASASPTAPSQASGPSSVYFLSGSSQIYLQWQPVSGATGYKIYWGSSSSLTVANGAVLSGISQTQYTHTGLVADQSYYYLVTAITGSGETLPSSLVSSATLSRRIIFGSSSFQTGAVGGITGGNAICDNLAVTAGLAPGVAGHYVAVVSTSTTDAYCNVIGRSGTAPNCGLPIAPPLDSTALITDSSAAHNTVTSSLATLWTGASLSTTITYTETGANVGGFIPYTGTGANGQATGGAYCNDLTSTSGTIVTGSTTNVNTPQWINGGTTNCSTGGLCLFCMRVY